MVIPALNCCLCTFFNNEINIMADHIMLTSCTSIAGFEVPAQLSYSSHLGQV